MARGRKISDWTETLIANNSQEFLINNNGITNKIKWLALKNNVISTMRNKIIVTSDYSIPDSIPSGTTILVKTNTSTQYGIITITLPTLADNIGKWYEIKHDSTNDGLIIVDGEGSEKLRYKGIQIETNKIYSKGDSYKYYNNGVDWEMSGGTVIRTGLQNRSDWTSVTLGNAFDYDNKSDGIDLTGMIISEATSLQTAVVVYDSGGTGTSGTLYVYNIDDSATSTGLGVWTNNRVITASDGTTCDVNEASGTSKNTNNNFCHSFGVNLLAYFPQLLISSSVNYNNSFYRQPSTSNSDVSTGCAFRQVDSNNITVPTHIEGMQYISGPGSGSVLNTNDWYYELIIEF